MVEAAGEDERELAAEMAAAFLNENLPEAIFGSPKAGAGQWASLVRLVNPIQGSTLDQVQLEQNEAAFRWVVLMMGGWGLSEVKQSDPGLLCLSLWWTVSLPNSKPFINTQCCFLISRWHSENSLGCHCRSSSVSPGDKLTFFKTTLCVDLYQQLLKTGTVFF